MLSGYYRTFRAAVVLCAFALFCLNTAFASPVGNTFYFSKGSPPTAPTENPFGDISKDTINLLAEVSKKLIFSSHMLGSLKEDQKLAQFWKTLEVNQASIIEYMSNLNDQPDSEPPEQFETGLWPCQLSKIPDYILLPLRKIGLPACQIPDATMTQWRQSYFHLPNFYHSKNGDLYSFEKYANLDPEWVSALSGALGVKTGVLSKATFNTSHNVIQIKDRSTLSMALVGDWGTGNYKENGGDDSSSYKVMQAITQHKPDLNVHLGDVYYAGTKATITGGQGEEQTHFLNLWRNGSLGSFSLNSNHEMNSGGTGYFDLLLKDPRFKLQQAPNHKPSSFFVIEFGNWAIIGLDTAYYAKDLLSKDGALTDPAQRALLKKYGESNKKLFLISHHSGMTYDGKTQKQLWKDVMSALGRSPDYWYWGHEHFGIVYSKESAAGTHTRTRCSGHGAIPKGRPTSITDDHYNLTTKAITFLESTYASHPSVSGQILNGFALVTFTEDGLEEAFYDENNRMNWSGHYP